MTTCVGCGTANDPLAPVCSGCGEPLAAACTRCGADLPGKARFCPMCGLPVGAGIHGSEETIKLVTVMFADMVGSTVLAEKLGVEDFRDLMTSFFDAVSEEIRAEGGTIEKFVGDAVLAVFGVPTSHEDDPIRAIRAGRRLLVCVRRFNASAPSRPDVQIRVGINTGKVVASGAFESDLFVTGDTVNLAARLEKAAEPGSILIGERTARTARNYFFLRALGPISVKGLSTPTPVWLVEGERELIEAPGLSGRNTPMIGRTDETELLESAFERVVRGGAAEIVTIVGDAGIGKSRLVREFVGATRGRASVLMGRCVPYGEGVTLRPLEQILKAESGVLDTDQPSVAYDKLRHMIGRALSDPADQERAAAALASTIGLDAPEAPLAALDAAETYRELVWAWRCVLAALAEDGPLVVVIEDLHWADPTMLDVIEDLVESISGPVLFLCPARPELIRRRPDWGEGKAGFSAMSLDPLTAIEGEQLISFMLDVEHTPAPLKTAILEKSEGNPFYIEEIVRRLIDEGHIVQESGRLRAGRDLSAFEIPDNVQAVIAARLDLLEPIERQVVQQAAVVGRTFWEGAVEHLTARPDLRRILQSLQWRDLIRKHVSSSIERETEYAFRHVLIRDVAYQSIPKKERARVHAAAGLWLQKVSGDRADELAEVLATHFEAAAGHIRDDELRRQARHYCLIASRNAHRRFNMPSGAEWGRKAVLLSEPGRERAEALEAFGTLTLDGDLAWEVYTDALAELDAAGIDDSGGIVRLCAMAAIVAARFRGAMRVAPAAEEINDLIERGLDRAGPGLEKQRALLLAAKAFMQLQGYEPMDEIGERCAADALALAEQIGDADVISAALDCQAAWIVPHGRYGDISAIDMRRLALVPRLSSVAEVCDAFAMAAWTSTHIGDFGRGMEQATACIQRAKGRDSQSYLHGLVWRIQTRFFAGEWDGAFADHAELERLVRMAGEDLLPPFAVPAYATAMLCSELRGYPTRVDAIHGQLLRYRTERERRHAIPTLTEHLGPAARALAHRGDMAAARKLVRLDLPSTRGVNLEALCEIVAADGAWDEADEVVRWSLEESERGGLKVLPLFARRLRGLAEFVRGEHGAAENALREAAHGFAQAGAPWEAALSSLRLAEVLIAGGRTGDAERTLYPALTTFRRLKSTAELERARQLLESTGTA